MSDNAFVHLRVHSHYSVIDSMIGFGAKSRHCLVKAVTELQQHAVAINDNMTVSGLIQFYLEARSHNIKPILAADIWLQTPYGRFCLPLFAMNETGYQQLCRILSHGCCDHKKQHQQPTVDFDFLVQHCSHLIALCGGVKGCIAMPVLKANMDLDTVIKPWLDAFGDRFYLEIHRHGLGAEEEWIEQAVELSKRHQVPLVATNQVRFINPADSEFHDMRVCINQELKMDIDEAIIRKQYSPNQYLRSSIEMQQLFVDLPSAVSNTVAIAKRCNCTLILNNPQLPEFVPADSHSSTDYFRQSCRSGLRQRLAEHAIETTKHEDYWQRLEQEMTVIEASNFIGYFLIVADFVLWAKNQKIPVGPGRGSGAGSLVAFCLGITEVDPLHYDLLFERFLNKGRTSMPDFDIDFCIDGRERVIQYVIDKYGANRVAQITTFGRLSARSVVRDVVRILNLPPLIGDEIAKKIPNSATTIQKAFAHSSELVAYEQANEEASEILHCASQLEGLIRQNGKHAAGVVIAPSNLTDFSAVYVDSDDSNMLITQYDKDDVEKAGLVKFDFLGLKTLTVINNAVAMINKDNSKPINIAQLSLDDPRVFQLIEDGETDGIFQMESDGMKKYIKQLKFNSLDRVIDMVALFRPGPIKSKMIDQYIERSNGAKVEVKHAWMKPILANTFGTIVYQEQVMRIVQKLAGFSLSSADDLRKAMGKKDKQLMAKKKDEFLQGSKQNNISTSLALSIYEEIEKFAEYGFNKSHSAAYAIVSYQTAWLKQYYRAEFYTAIMSTEMHNHDQIHKLYRSAVKLGIRFSPVCVNHSKHTFTCKDKQTIIWALGVIKGVGDPICNLIEAGRETGKYENFFDFCVRAQAHNIKRHAMEKLIYAGALDCFQLSREQMLNNITTGINFAKQQQINNNTKQLSLFASSLQEMVQPQLLPSQHYVPLMHLLSKEEEFLGINLQYSCYQLLTTQMQQLDIQTPSQLISQIQQFNKQKSHVGNRFNSIVFAKFKFILNLPATEKKQESIKIKVEDNETAIECIIENSLIMQKIRQQWRLTKGQLLVIIGYVAKTPANFRYSLHVEDIQLAEDYRQHCLKHVQFCLQEEHLPQLLQILQRTQNNASLQGSEKQQHISSTIELRSANGKIQYQCDDLQLGNELTAQLAIQKDISVQYS